MDKTRRKLTYGMLSLPIATSLYGCNSDNNNIEDYDLFKSTALDKLKIQLEGDGKTAEILFPFIEDACFNMELDPVNVNEIDCVVAYAFGNRPNSSGNPNELAEPGPMNKSLADCCAKIYSQKPVPLYVQWEIARHLETSDYMDIPSKDIISIEPYWDDNGDLVYLSTEGVAKAVISDHFSDDPSLMGTVGIVGHRDHAKRCLLTSKSVEMNAFHVDGIDLPVWYDELSDQNWTRKRELYVLQDMAVQLFTIAQLNIAKA